MSKIKFYDDSAKTNQVYPELDPEEMAQKANIDGYYESMTVGAADNLTGRGDGVPASFLYRTAGGDEDIADGIATIQHIKGNTISWNSRGNAVTNYPDVGLNGSYDSDKHIINLVYDSTSNTTTKYYVINLQFGSSFYQYREKINHKIYVKIYDVSTSGTDLTYAYINGAGLTNVFPRGIVQISGAAGAQALYIPVYKNTVGEKHFHIKVIDLTQMFGAGNEPTNLDYIEELFPLNYYDNNDGEFLSFNPTSLKTVGFNQWDEEWEVGTYSVSNGQKSNTRTDCIRFKNLMPIFPNTTYYKNSHNPGFYWLLYYDENKKYLGYQGKSYKGEFTTPADAYYMTSYTEVGYGDTYKNDLCINLSWSGYRNGEYEPYWSSIKQLPISTYFPNGMNGCKGTLNGTTIECYDELTKDEAIQRLSILTFNGSEDWQVRTNNNDVKQAYVTLPSDIYDSNLPMLVSYRGLKWNYDVDNANSFEYGIKDGILYLGIDTDVSATSFKSQLNSKNLKVLLPLANPIITSLELPINLSYKVSDFGTEEILPNGGITPEITNFDGTILYGMNAVDTLRRLPINYVSKNSMDNFLDELEDSTQSTWSATYNENTGEYDYETDLDLSKKANIDGYYEEMTVGAADNLTGRGSGAPALFRRRTSGGDEDIADGTALLNKIKGRSIVWNQRLARKFNSGTYHTAQYSNGVYTLTWDTTGAEGTTYAVIGFAGNVNTKNTYGYLGHTLYVRGEIIEQTGTPITFWYLNTAYKNVFPKGTTVEEHGNAYTGLYIPLYKDTAGSMKFTVSVFDLTRMFGAGNELSMNEFDYLFPDNCSPAKIGEIINLNDCTLKTVGFNQWDEEWEQGQIYYDMSDEHWGENRVTAKGIRSKNYIPVFPNTNYYGRITTGQVFYILQYDENYKPIAVNGVGYIPGANRQFTTTARTRYIRFYTPNEYGTVYKYDICINIAWSGYRNGEYEEYWISERELPINTYFTEGMKSTPVAYDELTKDRAISRVGTMIFDGSDDEGWVENPNTDEGYKAYYIPHLANTYPDLEEAQYTVFGNRILLNTYSYGEWSSTMAPYTISLHNISGNSWIVFGGGNIEALNTLAKFKALLASRPLIINYTKKEEVATEIDNPLNMAYKVSDFGTEQIVFGENIDDNSKMAPLNADILYGMNAVDTLRRLPINYVSKDSMGNFLDTLGESTQSTWSATYNDETEKYDYNTDLDLTQKANIDGYYEEMTVGAADNLTGKGDGVPAIFTRRTAGGDEDIADGVATVKNIKGNTLVWNQLVQDSGVITGEFTYGERTYDTTTKKITLTWDTTGATNIIYVTMVGLDSNLNNRLGMYNHRLYVRPTYLTRTTDDFSLYINVTQQNSCRDGAFTTINQSTYQSAIIGLQPNTTGTLVFKLNIFDLTKMFGAGNEPSTPAEFNELFPLDYYEYDFGSLISFTGESLKTVGFNQWDEVWEQGTIVYDKNDPNWGKNTATDQAIRSKNYVPVFPNTTYYGRVTPSVSALWCIQYDCDYNPIEVNGMGYIGIKNTEFTTTKRTAYIRFYAPYGYGNVYKNDICISLAWSGYRNGEYEPYWENTRELPTSTYFPDGINSASGYYSGNFYECYDELTPTKAIQRMGRFVYNGTENWQTRTNSNGVKQMYAPRPSGVVSATSTKPMRCNYGSGWHYAIYNWSSTGNYGIDSNFFVCVPDDETVETWKAKLQAKNLIAIMPLATPIETDIEEPLNLSYKVSDFGTEEILPENTSTPTTSPFNGQIVYGINATDTIRRLPENYMSEESMEAFLSALNTVTNGTWTMTYNSETGKYGFTFTPNQGGN